MIHPHIPHLEYLDCSPQALTHVYCHKCGVVIQGLVYDDDPHRIETVNETIVHHHLALMTPYPQYDEVTVAMDDNTAHVMAFCRRCAQEVSLEEVAQFYRRDCAAWVHENRTERDISWMLHRTPVAIVQRGLK